MAETAAGPIPADLEISLQISRYFARSRYTNGITARPWQLSVTESVALPPNQTGGQVSNPTKFDSRHWGMPPALLLIVLVLLIAAAVNF
ncbi:hypothetical protein [Bradyrhizobium betae]|uniref:hypothetical protein n=1 Tax=Bradyrhizobium betae TaxID=244734 RepID=UPI00100FCA80|nr:hypothetical protein [Bradyrhizobium betae]